MNTILFSYKYKWEEKKKKTANDNFKTLDRGEGGGQKQLIVYLGKII